MKKEKKKTVCVLTAKKGPFELAVLVGSRDIKP